MIEYERAREIEKVRLTSHTTQSDILRCNARTQQRGRGTNPRASQTIRATRNSYRVFFFLQVLPANGTVLRLDVSGITHGSYIGYYEVASYDIAALRRHRNRMRRDVTDVVDNQPLLLRLKALDK